MFEGATLFIFYQTFHMNDLDVSVDLMWLIAVREEMDTSTTETLS